MFRRFRLAQLVRSFFHIPTLPACLRQLVYLYERIFPTDPTSINEIKNNVIPHDLSFNPRDEEITWRDEELGRLSDGTVTLLEKWLTSQAGPDILEPEVIKPYAFLRQSVLRYNQRFSTSQKSLNNSHVLFYPSSASRRASPTHNLLAGRIEEVFSHTRNLSNGITKTQTFVVVAPFKTLSSNAREADMYRRFPEVANQIFSFDTGKQILLPMDLIISHFAHVPINLDVGGTSQECFVGYPLNV